MILLKYVHYVYLIMALLFVYDGITKYQNNENPILLFLFAAVALFMFFFRRHFSKKIQDNNK